MKRILGMVVAIAGVLAFGSAATAAQVTFDVSGPNGTSWSRNADAILEGPPVNGGLCTPGMQSEPPPSGGSNNCFRYSLQPGSSITIDIAPDNTVTMIGGFTHINTSATPTYLLDNLINLQTNITTTIYGATANTPAATGVLSGDTITWLTPANISKAWADPSASPGTTGNDDTIMCTDSDPVNIPVCGSLSMPHGVVLPFEPIFTGISSTTGVSAFNLGTWLLDPTHTQILASSLVVTRWSISTEIDNGRAGGLTFGSQTGLGAPVPEPGAAALVLLGLGALALRSRKA
jgi:hypothetical protein